MRNFLMICSGLVLLGACTTQQPHIVFSNNKNIEIVINGKSSEWRISPEVKLDVLNVYCDKSDNEVIFQTDIDTVRFSVRRNDTLRFPVVLNTTDTVHTAIVGLWDIPNNINKEDKVYWFSQLWSEVKYNFVNIDKLNFNLDSLYRAMIPEVVATTDNYEYYQVLKKFTAYLHDGHTQVSNGGQFYAFRDYIPLSLKQFDGKIYITRVRKVPSLDSLWVGAEIVEVDGLPVLQYLEKQVFPFISASTEQHLWMQAVVSLQGGFKSQKFNARIKKSDGTFERIELLYNGESTRTPEDEYWGASINYSRNIVELDWKENNIALMKFNSFYPEDIAMREFDAVIKGTAKAKGMIIDLRSNGGGSTEVGWHLQKHLTPGDQFLNYAWETRISDGVKRANGNWIDEYASFFEDRAYHFEKAEMVEVEDTIKKIKCPVVILIGEYTFSAAEDFLVNIYEVPGRPMLIGEETGGSTGSPLVVYGFPGDGYARICTRRICYPISEERFVNSGVRPDIEVKQSIDDYLNEKDVVLEKAIEVLSIHSPATA